MEALVELLGDPQRNYRSIHLTGTNGKTSTARMIDELLRAFGLRSGRYTSPHLSRVTERIVLDGEPVSDRTFVEGYRELEPYLKVIDDRFETPLSFFEIVTALAYSVFADAPIDVAVVEVGLGGTWDNTNVIDAEVAVVTPIGLDHVQYLGDTVAKIAAEKAGIIKPGAVAVLAAQPTEAAAELLRRAGEGGGADAPEGRGVGGGGGDDRPRRAGVGGGGPARGRRRPVPPPPGPRRRLRRDLPAAPRRPPGPERRVRTGRGRGVLRRHRRHRHARRRDRPGRVRVRPLARAPRGDPLRADHPPRRRPQPGRAQGHARGGRRVLPVPAPRRGHRGPRRQGRLRNARAAGAGGRRAGRHRERLEPRSDGRRAGRRGGADLRQRPRHRRAPAGRRHRGRGPPRRGHGRRNPLRHRRADHRLGGDRRRGPDPPRRVGLMEPEAGTGRTPESTPDPTPEPTP